MWKIFVRVFCLAPNERELLNLLTQSISSKAVKEDERKSLYVLQDFVPFGAAAQKCLEIMFHSNAQIEPTLNFEDSDNCAICVSDREWNFLKSIHTKFATH